MKMQHAKNEENLGYLLKKQIIICEKLLYYVATGIVKMRVEKQRNRYHRAGVLFLWLEIGV